MNVTSVIIGRRLASIVDDMAATLANNAGFLPGNDLDVLVQA